MVVWDKVQLKVKVNPFNPLNNYNQTAFVNAEMFKRPKINHYHPITSSPE